MDGSYEAVTSALDFIPNDHRKEEKEKVQWCHEVVEGPDNPGFDFINEFMDILEGKYEALTTLGIDREDITVWKLYAYDAQCNMEFRPESMKRLGLNGIGLCITCWDISEQEGQTEETDQECAK